jgi:hypothetical protein
MEDHCPNLVRHRTAQREDWNQPQSFLREYRGQAIIKLAQVRCCLALTVPYLWHGLIINRNQVGWLGINLQCFVKTESGIHIIRAYSEVSVGAQ